MEKKTFCILCMQGTNYKSINEHLLYIIKQKELDYCNYEYDGADMSEDILSAIKNSKVIFLCHSGNINMIQAYKLGFSNALDKYIVLINLNASQCENIPDFIEKHKHISIQAYNDTSDGWKAFLKCYSDILDAIKNKDEGILVYKYLENHIRALEKHQSIKIRIISQEKFLEKYKKGCLDVESKNKRYQTILSLMYEISINKEKLMTARSKSHIKLAENNGQKFKKIEKSSKSWDKQWFMSVLMPFTDSKHRFFRIGSLLITLAGGLSLMSSFTIRWQGENTLFGNIDFVLKLGTGDSFGLVALLISAALALFVLDAWQSD